MEAKTAYAKSKRSRRRIGCAPPGGGAPAPEDRDAPDPADDREQAAPLRGGRRGAASSPTRASWGVWRGPGRAVRRHPDVRVGSPLNRASWGVWRGPGRAARRHPDVRVGSSPTRASWGGSDGCPPPHLLPSARCPPPHLLPSARCPPPHLLPSARCPPPHLLLSGRCPPPHLLPSGRCPPPHLLPSGRCPPPHLSCSGGRCCTAYNRRPRASILRAGVSCGNLSQKETTHAPAAPEHAMGVKSEMAGTIWLEPCVPASLTPTHFPAACRGGSGAAVSHCSGHASSCQVKS